MKLWIFSDLHLEIAHLAAPLAIPDAEVCIMAGDLCRGPDRGVEWLAETIAHAMPCIYLAGNHEFYRGGLREGLAAGREAEQGFANVHFLENDFVVIDGVRFIGATLWTDYRIQGHQLMAMAHAQERMNDYRAISLQRNPWMRFTPEAAYRLHEESRTFIDSALRADHIPTVVVTHHLPHEASVAERFKGDLLNAAFASDLTDMLRCIWGSSSSSNRLTCFSSAWKTTSIGIGRAMKADSRYEKKSPPTGVDEQDTATKRLPIMEVAGRPTGCSAYQPPGPGDDHDAEADQPVAKCAGAFHIGAQDRDLDRDTFRKG